MIDRQGRIVARSSALGGRYVIAESALRDRRARFSDGALGNERLRIYTAPLGELGRGEAAGGAVVVAGSRTEIDRTLDHTRRLVAVCALAAALIAAVLATLLTRRALRPLTELSSGARAIERSGDPAERLPAKTTGDEVGELADTLNAMLASLERAQEAEHRFVGDASHELRTPLTALRGNAAYIARHGADPEVIAEIEAGAQRLSELLDDLLALAREDAAAPAKGEPVALSELAQGADEVIVEQDVTVRVERAAFERAVENLVRNARKHGQGKVTITVGAHDGEAFLSGQRRRPRHPAPRGPHDLRPLRPRQRRARRGLRPRPGDREGDRRAPRRPRQRRRRELHARRRGVPAAPQVGSAAGVQVLDVVVGVVVDELRICSAQGVRGALLGRLVLAHGDADDEVTFTQVVRVPACVLSLVAQRALQPALDVADHAVRFALDVDPADVRLARQHVVAVGRETRLGQALAGGAQRCVVEERSDHVSARIGEPVASDSAGSRGHSSLLWISAKASLAS